MFIRLIPSVFICGSESAPGVPYLQTVSFFLNWRKVMLRILLSLTLLLMLVSVSVYSGLVEEATKSHPATDAYDGWHLAVQAWTFNKFTFEEAVEKTASLGLDWIEGFPGQVVSKNHPDWKMDPSMPAEQR